MQEALKLGAFLEQDIVFSLAGVKAVVPSPEIAKIIRAVGPEHCVMATDAGQVSNPTPVEMMRYFIREMLTQGIQEAGLAPPYYSITPRGHAFSPWRCHPA